MNAYNPSVMSFDLYIILIFATSQVGSYHYPILTKENRDPMAFHLFISSRAGLTSISGALWSLSLQLSDNEDELADC